MDISDLNVYIYRMDPFTPFDPPHIEYCDLVKIDPFWEKEEHIRPVWKLYWNDRRGAALEYGDSRFKLSPERIVLVSPMTPYVPRCAAVVEHLYIHFRLPAEYGSLPHGIWQVDPGESDYREIREAVGAGSGGARTSLVLLNLVCSSLLQLPRELFELSRPDPLAGLFGWLETNLHRDCSNRILAGRSGYSEDTLHRVFVGETGLSPQVFVRRMRISRGANLLRQTDRKIDEIAELCGFCDRAHFHKSFQRRVGVSPAAFRKSREKL